MRRRLLSVGAAVALVALVVGPSAQARVPAQPAHLTGVAVGHATNEWLMMGIHCGASRS